MNFNEYMDKEIPTWGNELKDEYLDKLYNSYYQYIHIEKEIEICEQRNIKNPQQKEFYKKIIEKRKKDLEKAKEELDQLIEKAKNNLGREKSIYERTCEALARAKNNKSRVETMNKEIEPADEHGKKL